tara:strand:- start:323 stop:451 length:129 start_codon:yes stop_codon:yes gene_type:complete
MTQSDGDLFTEIEIPFLILTNLGNKFLSFLKQDQEYIKLLNP